METILSHTEHTRKRFHCTLKIRGTNFRACSARGKIRTVFTCTSMVSIRGTKFIAHCAYAERVSLPAEHTRNGFHRWLSIRENVKKSNISAESNMIFKNLVLQALGTIRFRFLQKKYFKKFHACVPLTTHTLSTSKFRICRSTIFYYASAISLAIIYRILIYLKSFILQQRIQLTNIVK